MKHELPPEKEIITQQKAWLYRLQNTVQPKRANGTVYPILCSYAPNFKDRRDGIEKRGIVYGRTILRNEIVFDFDSEDWDIIKREGDKLITYLSAHKIPHLLAWSGGKGVHVHVFFDPASISPLDPSVDQDEALELIMLHNLDIPRQVRIKLFDHIVREAGIGQDAGLDDSRVSWSGRGMGQLIRDFGAVRENGAAKTLLNEIPAARPVAGELPLIIPGPVVMWDASGCNGMIAQSVQIMLENAKGSSHGKKIEYAGPLVQVPCYAALMKGRKKGSRNIGAFWIARFNFISGVPSDAAKCEMLQYSQNCEATDRDLERECIASLEYVYRKTTVLTPSCANIKRAFGRDICRRDECPFGNGGSSPKAEGAGAAAVSTADRALDIATRIVELILRNNATLLKTPLNEPYIQIWREDHNEVRALDDSFKGLLFNEYYKAEKKVANVQAVGAALATLAAKAKEEGEVHELSIRVAKSRGEYWLDLCDDKWRAVRISPELPGGWEVVDNPPILFKRTQYTYEIPEPVKGKPGKLDELIELVNVKRWQLPMFKVVLITDLVAEIEKIAYFVKGFQGTGKSSAEKLEKALIDPMARGKNNILQNPKKDEDLELYLTQTYIAAIDNVSHITTERSDLYGQVVTGAMRSRRELYKDRQMVNDCYSCALRLNGLSNPLTLPDALSRFLTFESEIIPDDKTQSQEEWWTAFYNMAPGALGDLLTLVSKTIEKRVKLNPLKAPRLAEWYAWAEAAHVAAGGTQSGFLELFNKFEDAQNLEAISQNQLSVAITAFIDSWGSFVGTTAELLHELEVHILEKNLNVNTRDKGWPKNAASLGKQLRRIAPPLRKFNYIVDLDMTWTEFKELHPAEAKLKDYGPTDRIVMVSRAVKPPIGGVGEGIKQEKNRKKAEGNSAVYSSQQAEINRKTGKQEIC